MKQNVSSNLSEHKWHQRRCSSIGISSPAGSLRSRYSSSASSERCCETEMRSTGVDGIFPSSHASTEKLGLVRWPEGAQAHSTSKCVRHQEILKIFLTEGNSRSLTRLKVPRTVSSVA